MNICLEVRCNLKSNVHGCEVISEVCICGEWGTTCKQYSIVSISQEKTNWTYWFVGTSIHIDKDEIVSSFREVVEDQFPAKEIQTLHDKLITISNGSTNDDIVVRMNAFKNLIVMSLPNEPRPCKNTWDKILWIRKIKKPRTRAKPIVKFKAVSTLKLSYLQTDWVLGYWVNKWSILSLLRPHKMQGLSVPK